ncbi:chorismate mutase [Novosphingobium umbonatum]|uniref:chorismate mutase n=1 Tax=Novosphingobium umbonatum TaxID=1908524 RepID=A0A3S2UNT1_9SPHN|nr:chorismate mutase [Novosphingobium umbonatum]RVU02339.1 chorismate mutase [Novosphingobium umbonatum]
MPENASTPAPNLDITPVPSTPDPVLAGFRSSIDNIDAALIHMLAERFRITKAVGEYKATHALPASDPGREERQITRLRKLAEESQLDPDFGEKFLRFIIDEVIRHHEKAKAEA